MHSLVSGVLFVLLIGAVGTLGSINAGGYEAVWAYYNYKTDYDLFGPENAELAGIIYGKSGVKTHQRCVGTGPKGMCTFNEFIRHVEDNRKPSKYRQGPEGGRDTTSPDPDIVGKRFHEWGYRTMSPFLLDQKLADMASEDLVRGGYGNIRGTDLIERLADITQRLRRGEHQRRRPVAGLGDSDRKNEGYRQVHGNGERRPRGRYGDGLGEVSEVKGIYRHYD